MDQYPTYELAIARTKRSKFRIIRWCKYTRAWLVFFSSYMAAKHRAWFDKREFMERNKAHV